MEKHSIGPILEHYGAVLPTRRGWAKIRCPFHSDSHASAVVNMELNAFNCFGCGVKGDTYKILMEQQGVDFREAISIAEAITGKSMPSIRGEREPSGRVLGKSRSVARGRSKRTFRSCS